MDKEQKKSPIPRVLTFLVTLALVLGAVFLVANWQKLNFDFIRRAISYRSLSRNEDGQVESFSYIGGSDSTFARLGDDLLVCSSTGVRLYSPNGTAYIDQPCALSDPILTTGGSAALVYDLGGTSLFVYRDRELVFSLDSDTSRAILSASLSDQGLLTVVTEASGVKGAVTVYDASFQPKLGIRLSSRFITDAILSPDGKTLALATSGQSGGSYDSQIYFYAIDRAAEDQEPDAVCSLGNNAVLQLRWPSGPLRVLGEDALAFVNTDGTLAGTYTYSWQYRYLKGFSLEGDSFCTLLLGEYRAGTPARLVTVDTTGEELAGLPLDEQILSLSSAGRYLSLLTADGLTIYKSDLEVYHTQTELQGARKVLQRSDGSVNLIASETARLYLPD